MNKISVLLKIDFFKLELEEKLKIKQLGRPLPALKLEMKCEKRSQNRSFTRRFSTSTYYKNNWLCGCEVTNLVFCFPCVLFYVPSKASTSDYNWARIGVKDLQHLSVRIKKHESSQSHINACMDLALLGSENIMPVFNSADRQSVIEHNERVRKNRYILKKIISSIKFCSEFEFALKGHDEGEQSKNRGIFGEFDFSTEFDGTLQEHLKTSTVFQGTLKTLQYEILDSIHAVCKNEIGKQIKDSDYLSIQCDETTDITNWCQLVLIFRYVYNGTICENFWGFKKIKDQTAKSITKCIEEELDPLILQSPQKLIAQTYDGANVMSDSINGVQTQIKLKYPYAHYIHCYAHQLHFIMQKAASQHSKVRVFFNNLSAIPAFFSNFSNRCDVLEEIVKQRMPQVAANGWNYNIRTVNTVYENREKLIEMLKAIEERSANSVTLNEASGFRRALEDTEFMFWLTFFHRLFPHVEVIYNQIQSRHRNSKQLQKDKTEFETRVAIIRNDTEVIVDNVNMNFSSKKRKIDDDNLQDSVYAKEVCDVIVTRMKDRFAYRGHILADELFNNRRFEEFSATFPNDIFETVVFAYPFLQAPKLKLELKVVYSRPEFVNITGAINLLSFISQINLTQAFSEIVKLLKIILTTPMTTTEPERCFSTLKRIKRFLRNRNTTHDDRLNALVMMSINKNMVQDIDNFDEKVIEHFISSKDCRVDFIYKK